LINHNANHLLLISNLEKELRYISRIKHLLCHFYFVGETKLSLLSRALKALDFENDASCS